MAGTLTISGTAGGLINVVGNDYYPTVTDGSTWENNWSGKWEDVPLDTRCSVPINDASRDAINKKEEVKDMRGLFEIYVIDPDEEEVVLYIGGGRAIVADDAEMAMLIATRDGGGANFGKVALRKYHYHARKICDVPKPKEVQEVRVVKE